MKKYLISKEYNGKVYTCKDYFDLPIEDRETKVWFWPGKWFLWPRGMSMSFDHLFENKMVSEWDKWYKEIRKHYPVQSFFRLFHDSSFYTFFSHRAYSFKMDYYYPIRDFFFPRNKHISKLIPNGWINEAELMEKILYAFFLKVYDAGIDGWRDPKEPIWATYAKEFDECNKWIKVEQPALKLKIQEAWEKIPLKPKKDLTYEQIYGEVDLLEKEMNDKTTHWLNYIVLRRQLLN